MTDVNAYNDYDFEDHFDDKTVPAGPPDFLADFGPILLETCTEPETGTFASDLQDFARYLRALRLNAGWSRAAVAAKADCSEAHIVALENGQGPQSLLDHCLLKRLAEVFDVEVDEFYLLLEIEPAVEPTRPAPALPPHQLEMLHDINGKLNRALNLDEMLQTALQEALTVVGAEAGVILLAGLTTNDLIVRAAYPETAVALAQSVALRQAADNVVAEGTLYHTPDIFEEISDRSDAPFTTLLTVPIQSRDRVFGSIILTSVEPYFFKVSDEQFLSTLADHIAVMIEGQTLRDIGSALAHLDLKKILVKIIQSACYLMGTHSGAIVLVDETTKRPLPGAVKFPHNEFLARPDGLTYQVASSGCHFMTDKAQSHPLVKQTTKARGVQAIVGVPLEVHHPDQPDQSRSIGVLFIDSLTPRTFDDRDLELLYSLAGQAAVAIENARLYQAAHQEQQRLKLIVSRLTVLYEVVQNIQSTTDFFELLDLISLQAANLLDAEAGDLWLRDESRRKLTFCGSYGVDTQFVDGDCRPLGCQVAERVLTQNMPLLVNRRTDLPPALEQQGITALVSVPLEMGKKIKGVLNVYSRHVERTFSEDDRDMLFMLATQIVVALENALRFRQQRHYTQALESWHRTSLEMSGSLPNLLRSILIQGVKLLQAKGGRLYLVDADEAWFTLIETTTPFEDELGLTLAVGDSLIGQVIQTKTALCSCPTSPMPDLEPPYHAHDVRVVVGVPIICKGRVWGVISVYDQRETRHFSDADVERLTHFGYLAAAALENAEQLAVDQQAFDRVAALSQASRVLITHAKGQPRPAQLKLIAKEVINMLGVPSCDIALLSHGGDVGLQATYYRRADGRVSGNVLDLPLTQVQQQLADLTSPRRSLFKIPWQRETTAWWEMVEMIETDEVSPLKIPLVQRNRDSDHVVGLMQVNYSQDTRSPAAEDDEWILRLFAETAAAVLEEEAAEPLLTYDLPDW